MNLLEKYIFISLLIILLTPSIYSTLTSDKIISTDWIRHEQWARQYLRGDFSPKEKYPPLFQFLMMPFVYFNFPMKYFQIIFSVLSTFSILYFTHSIEGKETMLFMGILMASSIAYIQMSSSIMPQAIDYILFPLILFCYFKNKDFFTCLGLFMLLLNHAFGIIFFGIIFLHSIFYNKKILKYLSITFLIALPIIYPSYITQILHHTDIGISRESTQALYENQFINPPYMFFVMTSPLAWILLPYALYKLFIKKRLNRWQKIYAIWMFAFIPVLFINVIYIWRWASLFIIPFYLFESSMIAKNL